jgi:hypothetical protein
MTPSKSTVISGGFGSFGNVGLLLTFGFGTGAEEFVPTSTTPSGVGKGGKVIRLREVDKREDLGEFIKAQLNLKHADLLPQEQKKPRLTKAQKAEQQKIEIAMKSMAQELEQERLVQANNDLLTLMLLAEI